MDHPVSQNSAHLWRAPELGRVQEVRTHAGVVRCFERGEGRPIVFAHGWLTNANLWRHVVPLLSGKFRCLVLDLPFGSHTTAVAPAADLSPPGCGAIITDVLDTLRLEGVTLVGNDSGGAYCQIGVAARPDRIARLFLTSCETPYDTFPPAMFKGLKMVAQSEATLRQAMQAAKSREFRSDPRAYGLLAKRPIEDAASDSYVLPISENDEVLRDVCKVIQSASETYLHAATDILIKTFDKPVMLAWSEEDPVFPIAHARQYAKDLKRAKLALIDDAFSFTPEDQPRRLAQLIEEFMVSG